MLLFLWGTTLLLGQDSPDKDKIKSLKIAFLTERLSLSSSEAEVFWPLYNAFENDRDALRGKQHSQVYDKIRDAGSISERDAGVLLERYLALEEEEEELDRAFYRKMARELSARKTLLLFQAEHDFRRQLIKQMRARQGKGGP